MNFRVTQLSLARSALASIRDASENLLRSQEQLATGRRINRLSDAPLDAAQAERVRAHKTRLEQYSRNLEQAQSRVEYASSTLLELTDLFVQARSICVEGADATCDEAARRSLGEAVDQMLQQTIDRANERYNGTYLFAGSADDTAPFAAERGPLGRIAAVTYQGNDDAIELEAGPGSRVQTNEPGSAIFLADAEGPGAFEALVELRDLLLNTEGLSHKEVSRALSDHIDAVSTAHDRVVAATGRLGWRSSRLEFNRSVIENGVTADDELLSRVHDADFASAAAMLYGQQTALQSALVMAAQVMKHTLLEYL
ncbi:MAG: flagellar hook-associated protein FlgL [Candidatus Brocadiia bacterium]